MAARTFADAVRRPIDAWIGRTARPDPAAMARINGLRPAVAVTGASAGLGLALAETFARAGHPVILIARDQARLHAAAAVLARPLAGPIVPLVLDVTIPDAAIAIDRAARAAGLYVDILVNNAGIGLAGDFSQQSPSDLDGLLALNVAAATRLMRHALPEMLARGRGGILTIASLGAYTPGPYQATYYASKAYQVSLAQAVAHECRGRGVRIAVVVPGPVETGFHRAMGAEGALYRRLWPAMSPAAVARSAYRGYVLGRVVVAPGIIAPVAKVLMVLTPSVALAAIVGWLLRPGIRR
jgi:uncharacterized protein